MNNNSLRAVVALIAGVLLLAVGLGSAAGGVAVLALDDCRDAGGYLTSPSLSLRSSTAAITAERITARADDSWTGTLTDLGTVRVTATSPVGTPLFLGIARQNSVDSWLSGIAHDQVSSLDSVVGYTRAAGAVTSLSTPATQDFWLVTATGDGGAELTWEVVDGTFALVVANADGTTGVSADVRVATRVPDLAPLGFGVFAAGTVTTLVAVLLIILGGTGMAGVPRDQPGEPTGIRARERAGLRMRSSGTPRPYVT